MAQSSGVGGNVTLQAKAFSWLQARRGASSSSLVRRASGLVSPVATNHSCSTVWGVHGGRAEELRPPLPGGPQVCGGESGGAPYAPAAVHEQQTFCLSQVGEETASRDGCSSA